LPKPDISILPLQPWGNFGLNQAFGRALESTKLKGRSFHSLRHFFVTDLCRHGAPTMVVKQLAGHAELSTTERYAHMASCDLTAAISLFCVESRPMKTSR
jgi:site-specific recombinase XerD